MTSPKKRRQALALACRPLENPSGFQFINSNINATEKTRRKARSAETFRDASHFGCNIPGQDCNNRTTSVQNCRSNHKRKINPHRAS
jgi:hypothetical protein